MTTLTEARRALLEIDAEIPPFGALAGVHAKIALITAYLDSLVPLNIENNSDVVVATVNTPVEYSEIVRRAEDIAHVKRMIAIKMCSDPVSWGMSLRLTTEEMQALGITPQPSLNDVINTMMGAGPRGELRMSERYSLEPSSPIVFDANTACPNCINHGHKQPGCEHD